MRSSEPSRRSITISAIVASVLMLVSHLTYRVVTLRGSIPADTTPIDSTALERLPLQIADWVGQDIPLDEAIVRATDSDAYINRRYSRSRDRESISLFIACGTRTRDLMMHRPETCYIVAGWALMNRRPTKLPSGNGKELPCTVFEFSRGDLDTRRTIVLSYFIVNGEYSAGISLLQSKAWSAYRTVRYVAQIQIVASTAAAASSTNGLVSAFAVDSAPDIARLIESLEEELGLR